MHLVLASRALLIVFSVLLLASFALPASAHAVGTTGSLTIHDVEDGPASTQVADCTFWVRGKGFEVSEGVLDIRHNMGRAGSESILTVEFTGTADGAGGYDFEVGPISIPDGDYVSGQRVYAQVVVDDAPNEFGDPTAYVHGDTVRVYCGEKYIPCIDDLSAVALEDGSIRLDWSAPPNATHYFVARTDGTQLPNGQTDWETLANVTATSYVDTTAEPGVAYGYEIISSDGALAMSGSCPVAHVTAVPFFGGAVGAALALAGSVGAVAWLRRRS